MKTSELKKWLDEKGHEYTFIGNEITFRNSLNQILIIVLTDEQKIYLDSWIYMKDEIALLKKIIEYTETPISEREDEKKYYIEFGGKLDEKDKKRYLNLNTSTNVSFFHHDWLDLIDLESGCLCYKGKFTQSEIDNFPIEIKGAIECGFLRKVEVE